MSSDQSVDKLNQISTLNQQDAINVTIRSAKRTPVPIAMKQQQQQQKQHYSMPARRISQTSSSSHLQLRKSRLTTMKLATIIACSVCLLALLMPTKEVECGRLQDFIQNLVGGGSSSSSGGSSSSNSNKNSNSNSNTNSNTNNNDNSNSSENSNDSDTAASSDGSTSDQAQLTPMMSAMNPFMRYPSFYDSFGPAGFGGYPGMSSFSASPMSAMASAMSPMAAALSAGSGPNGSPLSFSPSAFSPASFASAFGAAAAGQPQSSASSANPLSAFQSAFSASAHHPHSAFGGSGPSGPSGMGAASTLSNIYAGSSSPFMAGYTPYYGRRR